MRLNPQTYPAYHKLESGNFYELQVDKLLLDEYNNETSGVSLLIQLMESLKATFLLSDKRYYITEPFQKAIETAYPKIIEGGKHINDIPNDCGILFTKDGFSLYLSNPADHKLKLLVFGFTRNALTTFGYVRNDNHYGGVACTLRDGKPYDDPEILRNYIDSMLTTIYFIHNCETEQKLVLPKQKHRANGVKYFNESKNDFIVLDCKWFTELIRTTPFHVRGHLRWQVYGVGKQKRKLIWIEDFEKSGYQRKANKEINAVMQ
jgi:hypothetical protein